MIYTTISFNTRTKVDTDRIANAFLEGKRLFVRTYSHEDRMMLIEFLEKEGFTYAEDFSLDRSQIVDSGLPLIVELRLKQISRIGNVTCAAAAASCGIIMSDKDFYLLYSLYSLAGDTQA